MRNLPAHNKQLKEYIRNNYYDKFNYAPIVETCELYKLEIQPT